jgi:hypothetical protein
MAVELKMVDAIQQDTCDDCGTRVSRWQAYKDVKARGIVPGTTTTLLSATTKMPSPSWSLPAGRACPAAKYGPGTICGSCYAKKNMYRQSSVQKAQQRRFDWSVSCMRTERGQEIFVETMVNAIRGLEYFRVHDAGDLFNPAYVRCWARIARALPDTRFWIPTRIWQFADRPLWAPAIDELLSCSNVTLRPSALRFEDPAPMLDGWAAGTTASAGDAYSCPAPKQNNECGDCRVCWDAPLQAVSYHKH